MFKNSFDIIVYVLYLYLKFNKSFFIENQRNYYLKKLVNYE